MAKSIMHVIPHFDGYIFDWDYETYLLVGGYGSGKSRSTVQKIVLELYNKKRKACVVRDVYETHKESTFDLIREVLEDANLLAEEGCKYHKTKVCYKVSPLEFKFPNGSRIIFKGMDSVEKVKSLNDVSIVWIEEASEISYNGYLEFLGRVRTNNASMHFILTCNPVGRSNWVYQHFFKKVNDDGTETEILSEKKFYDRRVIVKNGVYYHNSKCDDNPFLPDDYIKRLDDLQKYDQYLYLVARYGMFGAQGLRVLPNFEILNADLVLHEVTQIPATWHRIGMDFGFETSYNAVLKMAIDDKKKYLYIYKEYYKNNMTDDKTALDLVSWDSNIKNELIKADCAEPKAIRYYRQEGFDMIPCKKTAESKSEGSRVSNTKKVKRFQRIICSSDCINTIRELKDLTYKKDKSGNIVPAKFNIDPHTLSAIWYGLDDYTVANVKKRKNNSKKGG